MKARYSEHYKISAEELAWLSERVNLLRTLTGEICNTRLTELRASAAKDD